MSEAEKGEFAAEVVEQVRVKDLEGKFPPQATINLDEGQGRRVFGSPNSQSLGYRQRSNVMIFAPCLMGIEWFKV